MKTGRRQIRLARTALALKPKRLTAVRYARRKELPETAAVYMALEKGLVVYVGQTVNLRRRWIYHQLNYHPCAMKAITIAYLCEADKFNRELLESLLIIVHRPKFNGHGISAKSQGITSSNLRRLLDRARRTEPMKTKAAMTMFEHECQRPKCRHKWRSLMARPVVCPRCKSYSWDEKPRGKTK